MMTEIFDCTAKGTYPALQGDKKSMYPETNTLPKQHTPSLQGGGVDYHFSEEDSVLSPSLVYYLDQIEKNTDKVIAMAGGAQRLWPHVKTHKMAAMVRMQTERGISRFKCATIAEARMCAQEGAEHVLVSYPLTGPAVSLFFNIRRRYAKTRFWTIGDNIAQLENIGKEAGESPIDILIDVNAGMNRTGVPFDALAQFYLDASKIKGLRIMGLHCYDGHLDIKSAEERKAQVCALTEKIMSVRAIMEKQGLEVPVLVMGGTPTFPFLLETPDVFLSPGTIFVNDFGYTEKFKDLFFPAGAAILTRVISHPAPGLFTLDTGYKAIASDKIDRGIIAGLPEAKPLAHSEEHWVWSVKESEAPPIGTVLFIIPAHICPTTALYPGVHVVSRGKLAGYWEVSARDRFLQMEVLK